MKPKTFYYRCKVCYFAGPLEPANAAPYDANCPRCNSLLFPTTPPETKAPTLKPRRPLAQHLVTGIILVALVGAGYWVVTTLFFPRPDVWVYVEGVSGPEWTVFVDGEPVPQDASSGNILKCHSGTRDILIKQSEKTVYHETKTLEPPDKKGINKYILNLDKDRAYFTFELKYLDWDKYLDQSRDNIIASLDSQFDTQLQPTDELFPKKKQAKLNKIHKRQLEQIAKLKLKIVRGDWIPVQDCRYVLKYPPGSISSSASKSKPFVAKTIVPFHSNQEYERFLEVKSKENPTLEDLQFLGDFLHGIQHSGGS